MYSRSFYERDTEGYKLPPNYDGNALREAENSEKNATRPPTNENQSSECERCEGCSAESSGAAQSPLLRIGEMGKGLLGGLFGGKIGLPKIGTEEILILATAAFLFFSKDGDTECAILLLLLLLIH